MDRLARQRSATYQFWRDDAASRPGGEWTRIEGSEPTACATVAFLAGVAGVFGVAVREPWRRQGLGTALTAQCLQLAAREGCDLAFLNPSPMAHGIYAALGFRDALPFRIWNPPCRR